jgi:hypothetical protein
MSENIEYKVEGNKLIMTVDLKAKGELSKTGKTRLIASSRGAEPVDCNGARKGVKVAINVMVPA